MPYLVASTLQAGFPSPADDYLESPLRLDDYLIDNPAATFFVRIVGDSMQQAGIVAGDIAVVDRAKVAKSGDIVVAILDNQFLIKELHIHREVLTLKSHHPDYPSLVLPETEGNGLWGVVIGIIRKLN